MLLPVLRKSVVLRELLDRALAAADEDARDDFDGDTLLSLSSCSPSSSSSSEICCA
jgi:hypothetical protein